MNVCIEIKYDDNYVNARRMEVKGTKMQKEGQKMDRKDNESDIIYDIVHIMEHIYKNKKDTIEWKEVKCENCGMIKFVNYDPPILEHISETSRCCNRPDYYWITEKRNKTESKNIPVHFTACGYKTYYEIDGKKELINNTVFMLESILQDIDINFKCYNLVLELKGELQIRRATL